MNSNIHAVTPAVKNAFGMAMMAEGIPYFADAAHLVVRDKNGHWQPNGSQTVLFTPFPFVNGSACHRNVKGQPEFFLVNGRRVFNRGYWAGQRSNYFDRRLNANSSKMELVMVMHKWAIPESRYPDHQTAAQYLSTGRCGLGGNAFTGVLWKGVCEAFIRFTQCTMYADARTCGFHPLFVLRNCVFRGNGTYQNITSNDSFIGEKSYLSLAGFFKRREDGEPEVFSISYKGKFLSFV